MARTYSWSMQRREREVFAKPIEGAAKASDFWVRVGNQTKQLHGDELIAYGEDHWG